MAQSLMFTTPVGRMVLGDLYTPETTDADGKPLIIKNGPNAGTARQNYFVGIAVPKGPEAAQGVNGWQQTAWGQQLFAEAQKLWPRGEWQRPDFAWKIKDGDQPNKKGNKIAEAAGCWILSFGSGYPSAIWNATGSERITEPGAVKRGYYLQVQGTYDSNKSTQTPGMYMNHVNIALAAYGEEIQGSVDVKTAGFGAGVQLPAGASTQPAAQAFAATAAPVQQATPVQQAAPQPTAAAAAPAPNHAFLAPPPAAAPAGPVMTAKAAGAPWSEFVKQGWTEETARAHGYIV